MAISSNSLLQKVKNKVFVISSSFVLAVSGLGVLAPVAAHAATCTPTGFVRDSINLTAAMINPGKVKNATVNATGCNIGIYYSAGAKGEVSNTAVFGANYFGVVSDGAKVDVKNSNVHDIGESPLNGSQHGIGIYFTNGAKGEISNNMVSKYQKGGVVVNGEGTKADVSNNTVTGEGPVTYIAQNGIQISRGAESDVHGNTITGNAYSGTNCASSAGVLVYGGWGDPLTVKVDVHNNDLTGNDVGVYLANYNADATAGPSTATKVDVHNNDIENGAVTNISGYDCVHGYQAGISVSGNKDKVHNNDVLGAGYAVSDLPSAFVRPIDISAPYAIDTNSHNNEFNGSPYNG